MQLSKCDIRAIAAERLKDDKCFKSLVYGGLALVLIGGLIGLVISENVGVPIVLIGLITGGLSPYFILSRKKHKLADDLWKEYTNDNTILSQVRDILEAEEKGGSVIRDSQLTRQ